jgi:hypothetical protein
VVTWLASILEVWTSAHFLIDDRAAEAEVGVSNTAATNATTTARDMRAR